MNNVYSGPTNIINVLRINGIDVCWRDNWLTDYFRTQKRLSLYFGIINKLTANVLFDDFSQYIVIEKVGKVFIDQ